MKIGSRVVSVVAAVCLFAAAQDVRAGIFITGHDPIWHSSFGGNTAGATRLAQAMIDFARDGDMKKFLFIESKTDAIPAGNAREAEFLNGLGYTDKYDVMDAVNLNALADFRTTLDSYSAIVVASDHGGMLTSAELSFLNAHSADILDYINAGGGLAASAESNANGLIGATPRFGFVPFLVSSTDFDVTESGNTVTAFGASLGLTNSDVNGNFSHNYFASTGGMTPVDLFNDDTRLPLPLSLAFRGQITPAVPEPSSLAILLGLVACGSFAIKRRKRRASESTAP
jgi:hypothetical protein